MQTESESIREEVEMDTLAQPGMSAEGPVSRGADRAMPLLRNLGSLAVIAVLGLSMLGSDFTADESGIWVSSGGITINILPPSAINYVGDGDVMSPSSFPNTGPQSRQSADGAIIHSSTAAAGVISAVGLHRETDCSITEYGFSGGNGISGTMTLSTVPNFQASLHTAAHLTTTGGTWPNGCKDQELGIPARLSVNLGTTKDGSSMIGAVIDYNNNLFVATGNLTNGSYTTSELLTGTAAALVAADVNGDGYPDLLVQIFSGGSALPITVYLSNGDGTFTVGTTVLPSTATESFTADDINGDGKVDLVVMTANQILVLLGDGTGKFGTAIATAANNTLSNFPYVATGDFNGDGKKDLILSNLVVLLGDGTGNFTAAPSSPITASGPPVVGDWNNDGKQDVAFETTGTGGGIITTYLGNGDGTFTVSNSYATIAGATYLSASDLDGDGNTDLYVGEANGGIFGPDYNSNGLLQAVMGVGNGTFAGAQAYPNGTYDKTGSALDPFATADFHGKGYQDVLMLTDTGLEMLTNNGKGAFTETTVPGIVPTAIEAADMNGDGKSDAIFAEGSSGTYDIAVALGNGDGTFETKTTTAVPALPGRLLVGDFNGDGKPDIVMTSGDSVYLLLNEGNGTLKAPTLVNTEANQVTGIVAADLRNNGKLDLVLTEAALFNATGPGAVGVLLGDGNGSFQPETDITVGFLPVAVATGDMNKDGKVDLVVASGVDQVQSTTSLYVLPGKGDGTFGTATSSLLNSNYVMALAVSDLNQDGNLDVLIPACCGDSFTSIALGSGNGNFSSIGNLPLAGSSMAAGAVDLNGDGTPDLLINSNAVGSDLVVMLSQSAPATAPTPTTTTLSASATSVAAGASVTFTATVAASASGSSTPTGTVTFYDGTTSIGTGTLASGNATFTTTSLATGAHSITATYGGSTTDAASTSTAVSITVTAATLASTTTSLTSSASTITQGASVTFTATTTSGTGTPSGTVTFLDGTTSLGTGTLSSSGVATYSTSTLSAGTHSITASYAGDATYAASTSNALTETVNAAVAASFTIGVNPSSLTVGKNSSGSVMVTATPAGGFNQQITFSCSGLPANATCSFSPSTITPSGAAATTALTIATGVRTSALVDKPKSGFGGRLASGLALAVLLLPWGLATRRRKTTRRYIQSLLALTLLVGSVAVFSGCGSSSSLSTPTPAGISTVTVTATAGAMTQTATLQVTVN
jgi:hypothetical protein